ncbi:S8 family serine peptidase [Actinophytocola sp.]|uniref:S8 family serine peptidase n=1 Tax=Actinophytocola sp. TaxID=1872138 RepID=UPI003D6A3CD9
MTSAASGTTGRYLVLLQDDWTGAHRELNRVAGIQAVDSAEAGLAQPLWDADGLVMRELGVALVSADPDQLTALTAAAGEPGPIALVEPERFVHAIAAPAPAAPAVDETTFTWGLQAVRAPDSTATGAGVRVAVLDTGLDLAHPDLARRTVTSKSFVQGEEVQDGHGHGTHCVGTSCGPRTPATGPGYGVAFEAEIHAGKVLSDGGSGADGGILSGISWAIANGCRVISMSLGAATQPGQPYSRSYERVARRALARGTLIVAAAGNESERAQGTVAPVGHPANCPSVLAVGALDVSGEIADFSCGTVDAIGSVDLVGPGVDVHSSWPLPTRYRRISGTSMATPHVAGIAALIAQATGASGYELWARLAQTACRLPLPSTDVGAGLVQAP